MIVTIGLLLLVHEIHRLKLHWIIQPFGGFFRLFFSGGVGPSSVDLVQAEQQVAFEQPMSKGSASLAHNAPAAPTPPHPSSLLKPSTVKSRPPPMRSTAQPVASRVYLVGPTPQHANEVWLGIYVKSELAAVQERPVYLHETQPERALWYTHVGEWIVGWLAEMGDGSVAKGFCSARSSARSPELIRAVWQCAGTEWLDNTRHYVGHVDPFYDPYAEYDALDATRRRDNEARRVEAWQPAPSVHCLAAAAGQKAWQRSLREIEKAQTDAPRTLVLGAKPGGAAEHLWHQLRGWLGKYDLREGDEARVHGRHTYLSRTGQSAIWFSPLIGLWCVGHTHEVGSNNGKIFVTATGRGWFLPERAPGHWSFFREDAGKWEVVPQLYLQPAKRKKGSKSKVTRDGGEGDVGSEGGGGGRGDTDDGGEPGARVGRRGDGRSQDVEGEARTNAAAEQVPPLERAPPLQSATVGAEGSVGKP